MSKGGTGKGKDPKDAEPSVQLGYCGRMVSNERCDHYTTKVGGAPHWPNRDPGPPPEVRRCKLDPSLKAPCFQPLNLRVRTLLST